MLPPVWCASHVVGEKPPQAAWDRPRVPWEGCRPRRAFPATWLMPNRWHGGWQRKRTARPATIPRDPGPVPIRLRRLFSDHMARTPGVLATKVRYFWVKSTKVYRD